MLDQFREWAQTSVIVIGAVMALMTYRRDAKLRRSEWLYRLYQQFYENDRFDPVRRILDYEPEEEIRQLSTDIDNMDGTDSHEAFVDYLNFFEFIAVQLKNKNIRRDEVLDMFDYYIRRLGDHAFVVSYMRTYGYENLDHLVTSLAPKK